MSTETVANDYDFHSRALAGERASLPPDTPQCGWYAMKDPAGGAPIPLVIWRIKAGPLRAIAGEHHPGNVYQSDGSDGWGEMLTWFNRGWRSPVSRQAYSDRIRTGKWAHVNEVAAAVSAEMTGHNNPPIDERLVMLERLADLEREADRYNGRLSDDDMTALAGLMASAGKIKSALEEMEAADTKPKWKAYKDAKEAHRPGLEKATDVLGKMKAALDAEGTIRLREQRQREAEEAAAAAKKAAEEAAARQAEIDRLKELAKAGDVDALDDLLNAQPAAEKPPEPQPAPAAVGGRIAHGLGRSVSQQVKLLAVVTDYDKVLQRVKMDSRVVELVARIAQELVTAGQRPEGVKVEETIATRR